MGNYKLVNLGNSWFLFNDVEDTNNWWVMASIQKYDPYSTGVKYFVYCEDDSGSNIGMCLIGCYDDLASAKGRLVEWFKINGSLD